MPESCINAVPTLGRDLEHVLKFTSAFRGDTRGEIATVLLRREMSEKELERKLRVSRDRLSKHLTEMVEDGVVTERFRGNQRYFQLLLGDGYFATMKFLSIIANKQTQNGESPNAVPCKNGANSTVDFYVPMDTPPTTSGTRGMQPIEASEARPTPLASEESASPFPELLEVADMNSASPEERESAKELYAFCYDLIYLPQKALWKDQRDFQLDICLSWLRIMKGSKEKSRKALLLHLKRNGFVVINMTSSPDAC